MELVHALILVVGLASGAASGAALLAVVELSRRPPQMTEKDLVEHLERLLSSKDPDTAGSASDPIPTPEQPMSADSSSAATLP